MAALWKFFICGALFFGNLRFVIGTAEALSHVTAHFGKYLEECREEANLTPDLMEEFHHFWDENFLVIHREIGCAILCMSNKLTLVDDTARIQDIIFNEYILRFPDGHTLAHKMVTMIKDCQIEHNSEEDLCMFVTKCANCFKTKAKEAGLAPEVAMVEAVLKHY